MKSIVYSLFSFFLLANIAAAQTDLAIGQWKSHLPFNNGIYVTQSDEQVFYATQHAVLIIDKADHAIRRMTKVEGLSQVGVSLVKYNKGSGVLMVVYDNAAIDLVRDDGITTLPNIPESNIILGEKKVFDVFMANDSIAYLAANFGITTLNLRRGLFPSTIKTPMEVRNLQILDNQIFAATPEGIYTTNLESGLNINDFSTWSWLGDEQGFPPVYSSKTMAVFNGKLYADVNDSLFVYDGVSAQFIYHYANGSLHFLTAEAEHLLAGFRCFGGCFGETIAFNQDHVSRFSPPTCADNPLYAIEDAQGNIWYADEFNAFRVSAGGTNSCELINVNGPFSTNILEITVANGQVWIASGGLKPDYSSLNRKDGFFSLVDGVWSVHSPKIQPALAGLEDFYNVVVHPENGKVYASSIFDGLVEFDPATGNYTVFNETNSSLQLNPGDPTRSRAAGLAFDREGNLWICNNGAPEPLSVLKTDGSWKRFDLPCSSTSGLLEIAIDDLDNKWLSSNEAGLGAIVFNEGDFDDPSDDRCKILTSANAVLPTNEVTAIEVDLDGGVWVGTKAGALVFQCDPLQNDCPGSRPFVEVDGFGANLLEDQDVRTIGVDGANRKWFGTSTGVFVMSPEGNEQLAKFTTENSPLFDNVINDIAFNHETGEVFIGTQKGLVVYRGEAIAGGAVNSGVLVFPNPVRPEYAGPIAIKGLAQDATVKITDVSGQLVFETEALGGQAIWDGRDYNGRKATTGVYIVFVTSRSTSNPDVAVAKILLMN